MFTKPQTRFPTPQPVSKTLSDVEGGDLLLLHVDDWQDLDKFYNPPLAKHKLQWGKPISKNVAHKNFHPIFINDKTELIPRCLLLINLLYL